MSNPFMKFENPKLLFEWAYVQTNYRLYTKKVEPDFPF